MENVEVSLLLQEKIYNTEDWKDNYIIINDKYRNYNGGEFYYKYSYNTKITEGVKYFAEQEECFWFLDTIAALNINGFFKHEFLVWRIIRFEESTYLTCDDGNYNMIYSEKLIYTDFGVKIKEDKICAEIYIINNVILLPSEY